MVQRTIDKTENCTNANAELREKKQRGARLSVTKSNGPARQSGIMDASTMHDTAPS